MSSVFLIGDSIRHGAPDSPGYGRYVQEYLGPDWGVYAPDENCRFAQYTQRYFFEWVNRLPVPCEEISVIHWNNGLWDVIELPGEDTPFTDLPFYISSLRKVYHQIRRFFPNARVIFATSTPVAEEIRPQWCNRRNSVIREYNRAAIGLMDELGVEVNDLYAVAEKLDVSYRPDWVHFTEAGGRILAQAVAEFILKAPVQP